MSRGGRPGGSKEVGAIGVSDERMAADSIKEIAAREYGLTPARILPAKGGYLLDSPAGEGPAWFLWVSGRKPARLLFGLAAMEHLRTRGYGAVGRLLPGVSGQPYVTLDNDLTAFVTAWEDCRPLDLRRPAELRLAARALGELHTLSEGFVPWEGASPRGEWGGTLLECGRGPSSLRLFKRVAGARLRPTGFDRRFLAAYDRLASRAEQAVLALQNSSYAELADRARQRKTFCHGDFTRDHLSLAGPPGPGQGGRVVVSGFGSVHYEARVVELAEFLLYAARECRWSPDAATQVLGGYWEGTTMERGEEDALLALTGFPWGPCRVLSRYYDGDQDRPERIFIERLERELAREEAKQLFLRDLAEAVGGESL